MYLGTLLDTSFDEVKGTLAGLGRNHGANVGVRFVARVHLETLGHLNHVLGPAAGLADKHNRRQRHAALAGGAKGC